MLAVTARVFILLKEGQLITEDILNLLMGKYESCFREGCADSHEVTHLIWICMHEEKDNVISILPSPLEKEAPWFLCQCTAVYEDTL